MSLILPGSSSIFSTFFKDDLVFSTISDFCFPFFTGTTNNNNFAFSILNDAAAAAAATGSTIFLISLKCIYKTWAQIAILFNSLFIFCVTKDLFAKFSIINNV